MEFNLSDLCTPIVAFLSTLTAHGWSRELHPWQAPHNWFSFEPGRRQFWPNSCGCTNNSCSVRTSNFSNLLYIYTNYFRRSSPDGNLMRNRVLNGYSNKLRNWIESRTSVRIIFMPHTSHRTVARTLGSGLLPLLALRLMEEVQSTGRGDQAHLIFFPQSSCAIKFHHLLQSASKAEMIKNKSSELFFVHQEILLCFHFFASKRDLNAHGVTETRVFLSGDTDLYSWKCADTSLRNQRLCALCWGVHWCMRCCGKSHLRLIVFFFWPEHTPQI